MYRGPLGTARALRHRRGLTKRAGHATAGVWRDGSSRDQDAPPQGSGAEPWAASPLGSDAAGPCGTAGVCRGRDGELSEPTSPRHRRGLAWPCHRGSRTFLETATQRKGGRAAGANASHTISKRGNPPKSRGAPRPSRATRSGPAGGGPAREGAAKTVGPGIKCRVRCDRPAGHATAGVWRGRS